jgi:prepilin-type N-terminal cleavage/methylation domain-containing protein
MNRKGYTLTELLVIVAILGIFASMVFGELKGCRDWSSSKERWDAPKTERDGGMRGTNEGTVP